MKFVVSIPIAGTCSFEVEAEDEEGAKTAAWQAIDDSEDGEVTWEYFETLVDGNCLHPSTNEVEVQRIDEESCLDNPLPGEKK